ncbi:Enterochelin esterase [Nonlabens sp. Hel1_33_55]|uniref:alpha/beta hydrolase n=1 Tax=Nonlabens sp. Hel1_33_55 TaxID=1336802 RepID=UPI000875CB5E|nr:alpha/beta hydrolase-fold protein [Nonlabens sp. Hel1_33_55]SCY38724.1 Enterochelin esterase [Nonlabens sp. Hel1_33_55]
MRLTIFIFIALTVLSCHHKPKKTIGSESQFYTDSIYSAALSEYRSHNIYLPNDFDVNKHYQIMYATDGSKNIDKGLLKKTLDSLIENKIIEPFIFVASHANNKIADSTSTTMGNGEKVYLQFRNFEYIDMQPDSIENPSLANRYQNHMLYFKNEFITHIEKEFKQELTKNDRYFYGVSNGAGFGMSLLNNYPDIIGTYISLSTFGGDIQTNNWQQGVAYPRLYLQYGSEEPMFLKDDANFLKEKFKQLSQFSEIKQYTGGHDYKKWNEIFIDLISKLLTVQ